MDRSDPNFKSLSNECRKAVKNDHEEISKDRLLQVAQNKKTPGGEGRRPRRRDGKCEEWIQFESWRTDGSDLGTDGPRRKLRNVDESVEQWKNKNELLKEELSNSESMWAKEKESLKRTVRYLRKDAEKRRCRAENAEKALKVAKRGQMFEENDEESAEESEASEDYLSMRERLRRRSSRRDMSTDSAKRPSGQKERQEKKTFSGTSKWDKNSARWDEKVATWPNGAWLERCGRKTLHSYQSGEKISDCRSSRSQKSTTETFKEIVASMNKMMRVAALPEPKVFDVSGCFGEFNRTFLMKFREVV
uniref:Uncharacterized protein n=1 Tax=Caenorhabditis japonica TaxID=281687 RepID=A0A8R1EBK4_CAEJA